MSDQKLKYPTVSEVLKALSHIPVKFHHWEMCISINPYKIDVHRRLGSDGIDLPSGASILFYEEKNTNLRDENVLHKCKGGKMYVKNCDDCGEPPASESHFYCYSADGKTAGRGWIKVEDFQK